MRFLPFVILPVLVIGASAGCRKGKPTPPAVVAAMLPAAVVAPAPATEAAAVKTVATDKRAIRHVIIISEDGLRPDALMDVHPPVHDAIMHKGSWSMSARTIRHASTLPSHAA